MRKLLVPATMLLVAAAAPAPLHCEPSGEWSDACFVERLAANNRAMVALGEAVDGELTFSLSTDARRNASDDEDALERLEGIARRLGMESWDATEPEEAGGIPLEWFEDTFDPDALFIDALLALRAETIALTSEALLYSRDDEVLEEARHQRDDAARYIGLLAARNYEIPDIDLSGKRHVWRGWR